MKNFLFRKVATSRHFEVALLSIVLLEVLILSYIMLGLRQDINKNFSILIEKLSR